MPVSERNGCRNAGGWERGCWEADAMLNQDRLTIKAAETIQAAAQEAARRGNPAVADLHLLSAVLEQEEPVVVPGLQKVGVNVPRLRQVLDHAPNRPSNTIASASPSLPLDLAQLLERAEPG